MSMACSTRSRRKTSYLSYMDARISFSNDFAEAQMAIKSSESNYREAPVSSDFQFSVKNYRMIPADEAIFKGMLVPLKENCTKMTLRDALLADDDHENALPKLPKNSWWWKEKLGLKKSRSNDKKYYGAPAPPKTTGEME
ncbi:hypothetical protein HS088_TW07G01223 [Tripterygium wilfordii]|uniref:Uncharacterized protein n=1 Tax=Tripterygium wilfordii TaxID=458696 RepID=A0A7J7DH05_TRIWF|nr:uncharacterized protein LOC120003076 [Tripterygium wilfordii]KAF5745631.1 hypothetical protein HS088_TW07G01223 [Tripterygium wilfordii]